MRNDVSEWFPVNSWIETRLCDVSMAVKSVYG